MVAQCLDKDGASVMVHGTGGQDATLIVSSLAQVILNQDCRTVRGIFLNVMMLFESIHLETF